MANSAKPQTVSAAPLGFDAPNVFDAYVMVDWSAANSPCSGADSIWWTAFVRRDGILHQQKLENPVTRTRALSDLADYLSDLMAQGQRVLVGFDFCFGLPHGFSAALGVRGWRGLSAYLAKHVRDDLQNANNRFELAARMNNAVSGGAYPFWGCPKGRDNINLTSIKPPSPAHPDFKQMRLCDEWAGAKSPFQMAYAGAVGSQSLLGIAAIWQLRQHPWLAEKACIWPFESGFALPSQNLVFAEIYPSLVDLGAASSDAIKDRAQVLACAHHFANADQQGVLGAWLRGPADLDEAQKTAILADEGWILGLMQPLCGQNRPQSLTQSPQRSKAGPDLADRIEKRLFDQWGIKAKISIQGLSPQNLSPQEATRFAGLKRVSDHGYIQQVVGAKALSSWAEGGVVLLATQADALRQARIMAANAPPAVVIVCNAGADVTGLKALAWPCPSITLEGDQGGSDAALLIWDMLTQDLV